MKAFEPMALNDENVQAIYNRCVAKEDTPAEDRAECMAFIGICGYARDVFRKIWFSKSKIAEDKKNIYYLYGQLEGVHQPEDLPSARHRTITVGGCMRNCRGEQWFKEKRSLLMLFYIGAVLLCDTPISGFTSASYAADLANNITGKMPEPRRQIATDDVTFLSDKVTPTLSPEDSVFRAWWHLHHEDWE